MKTESNNGNYYKITVRFLGANTLISIRGLSLIKLASSGLRSHYK